MKDGFVLVPRPRFLRPGRVAWLLALAGVSGVAGGATPAGPPVAPPAPGVVAEFALSPRHAKCVLVEGLPVVGSAGVSDFAIREAAHLIRRQIGWRPDVLRAMARNRVRFVVMAPTEMTTDVPEHADLVPREYWNRRARGLGATAARPAVSCGEENLLCLPGDPYGTENILIHEFGHAIHERGLNLIDPTFDARLQAVYARAVAEGRWRGTYAAKNRQEYWAEGTQSWFDTNRANDREHGPIDTREKLKAYDPEFARLLAEVYGDFPWRYQRPERRAAEERAHLAGFSPGDFPRFRWPDSAPPIERQGVELPWLSGAEVPSASPRQGGPATAVHFVNRRTEAIALHWVDFEGKRRHYTDLPAGFGHQQSTYAGHVWVITEHEAVLGAVVAREAPGRIEIR